jgi:hypothetical protein
MPGMIEPVLKLLELFIGRPQNAIHGRERRIARRRGTENQHESVQIPGDCIQPVNVINLNRN